jgi:hypothetical protein
MTARDADGTFRAPWDEGNDRDNKLNGLRVAKFGASRKNPLCDCRIGQSRRHGAAPPSKA